MDSKIKNITSNLTNMHYLEVIDWLKDKSNDFEREVVCSINYFESSENNDLRAKVSKRVKEIIERNEK